MKLKKNNYESILKEKQDYYGETEASYHFAASEYARKKMIRENKEILKKFKNILDIDVVIYLNKRIKALECI